MGVVMGFASDDQRSSKRRKTTSPTAEPQPRGRFPRDTRGLLSEDLELAPADPIRPGIGCAGFPRRGK